ncbi:MAG: hypothetical protein E6649_05425 [Paeniclostridium sordellii]|nr:hypothetical protein [Paeniclostridium sordellii]
MTLATSASLSQVFDEFERIKNSIRIIERSELARDVGQYSLGDLGVYPQIGYANSGSVVRVPLSMLQKVEKDLIAENIKEGVNIFGLVGTLPFATEKLVPRMYICERGSAYRELDVNTTAILNSVSIDSNNDYNLWCIHNGGKLELFYMYGKNIYKYDDMLVKNTYVATDATNGMRNTAVFSYVDSSNRDRVFRLDNGNLLEYSTRDYTVISSNPSNISIITSINHNGRFRMFAFINGDTLAEINENNHSIINSVSIDRGGTLSVYVNDSGKLVIASLRGNYTLRYYDADTLATINTISANKNYVEMVVGFSKELIFKGETYKLK